MFAIFDLFGECMELGVLSQWVAENPKPDTGYLLRLSDILFLQFAGIGDDNGSGIYEGDIITVHKNHTNYPLNYVVVFNETELGFRMRWTGRFKDKDHNGFYDERISGGDCKIFKIIGNIYENPELVK